MRYLTTHTHIRLTAPFPGLPGWAGTRKVKSIWILLKQETVSGGGISRAICKSARRSIQTTTPTAHQTILWLPNLPKIIRIWQQIWYNFTLEQPFSHYYRAMLCIRGTSHGPVSVSLSVRPSQVGVLLKRLNVGSHKQHHTIPQGL